MSSNGSWEVRPSDSIPYFPYSYIGALLGPQGEVVAAVKRILARGAEGHWLIQTPAGVYGYLSADLGYNPRGDAVDESSVPLSPLSREERLAAMAAIVKENVVALQGDYAELRECTIVEVCPVCENYRVRQDYLSRKSYHEREATYACLPAELYSLVGFLREGSALCLGH